MTGAEAAATGGENTEHGSHFWLTDHAWGNVFGAKPTLIKNRWIYILDRREGQPVKLYLEVHADKNGAMTQVPGDQRRFEERTSTVFTPALVKSISMPAKIQGHKVRYFLFASPTRLTKRAIAKLEQEMARPSADWLDLQQEQNGRLFVGDGRRPLLLVVIDPLTTAVVLQSAYEAALDRKLHYVMPSEQAKGEEAEKIRARVLKYQLAEMITKHLLPERTDPFGVRKELADAMGDQVFKYKEEFEADLAERQSDVDHRAALLIEHLESRFWRLLARLHLTTPNDTAAWLNLIEPVYHRLGSCLRGSKYLGGLVDRPPPEFEAAGLSAEGEERDLTEISALVARKAAAGVAAIWAEVFPSAIALKKMSVAQALERIDRVQKVVGIKATWSRTVVGRNLRMTATQTVVAMQSRRVDTRALHQEMVELKEWTKEIEGRWPEEAEGARAARQVINYLRTFELINLAAKFNAVVDPNKDDHFDARCDFAGAILDTLVAFEDALKPGLKEIIGSERWAGAAFKFAGAASSLLDVVVFGRKWLEARENGETDMLGAYAFGIISGSMGTVGGAIHGGLLVFEVEGIAGVSLGIAASALCFSAVALAIAVNLYLDGHKKSAFQRFINHSAFGSRDDERRKAEWVRGGQFSAWTENPRGLQLQVETLSLLFGAFEVSGYDQTTVNVRLGATPPGSKLKITFIHGDQGDSSAPTHRQTLKLKATIDLFAQNSSEALSDCDEGAIWQVHVTRERSGSPISVRVGARPRGSFDFDPLRYCICEIQLVCPSASERELEERTTIPAEKPLHYFVVEGGGVVNRSPKSSLPEPD